MNEHDISGQSTCNTEGSDLLLPSWKMYHNFMKVDLSCSVKKYCSSLAWLDKDRILDFVLVFSELLCTAKEMKDCNYKKIFIKPPKLTLHALRKMR